MKKIALFGGSFDPIHTDHINIITAAKKYKDFDEIWIIPTYLNPFKNDTKAPVHHRLKMIEIAVESIDYVKIDKREILKKDISYTYYTVKEIIEENPNVNFDFIIGSDQLENIDKWFMFEELKKIIKFDVFLRDENYNKNITTKYDFDLFSFNNQHLSSTEIRKLNNIKNQIPKVTDYINENLLYLHDRLEMNMDSKRYQHSLNVSKCAENLALKNNIDSKVAKIAGLLHDVSKQWPKEKMKEYLLKFNKDLLSEPENVWHSYVGAFHLENDWLIKDKEIISSVYKHTVGDIEMSQLNKIVFIADKISEERDYNNVDYYRDLANNSIDECFKVLLKNQFDVAVKKFGIKNIGKELIKNNEYWNKEKNK